MFTGILVIALMGFIGVVSYRRRSLEERVFKEVPLIDWLILVVYPLLGYVGLVLIIKSILTRSRFDILDVDDFYILSVGLVFLVYSYVGAAIHFVGKVISRYLKPDPRNIVYRVNELFHGKLSHYMVYSSMLMMLLLMSFFEVNYPLPVKLTRMEFYMALMVGIVMGFSGAKAVFYTGGWFGGYKRPIFYLTSLLALVLLGIFRANKLSFSFYPLSLFVISMYISILLAIFTRRIFIVTNLYRKRRLKLLSKLLHA